MNEKKSKFGEQCYLYRGKLRLSEKEMGSSIEALGYNLGNKPGGNKQPLISQFERAIGPEITDQKQHRDPPLDYVEACAKLFELSSAEKFSLFKLALESSEKIVIEKASIEGVHKDTIFDLITSLLLSCNVLDNALKKRQAYYKKTDSSYYNEDKMVEIVQKWDALKKASDDFMTEIKKHGF